MSEDSKLEAALLLAVVALLVSVVNFFASAWHAEQTNQRLHRLENIVEIDEIGRRK